MAVGAFGTLVGVGGGFILVPIFLLVMHYSPQHTVGTSLAIVFLNALSGSIAYIKQQKVYYDAGIRFALATIPGAFLGGYVSHFFTSRLFSITFGVLLLFIAVMMYGRATAAARQESATFDPETFTYNRILGVSLSFVVGFLSTILGIGGGIIHVPIMVYLLGFPTHIATATSHFVLAISTFFGVLAHYIMQNILLLPALSIGAGALVGAQFGARLAQRVKSRPILVMLSVLLFLVGLRLIFLK